MGSFVGRHQPAGPRIRAVVEKQAVDVLVAPFLVHVVARAVTRDAGRQPILGIRIWLRLLLGKKLIERLARPLLAQRCPVPLTGRPTIRGDDSLV
jgi:hypothetical protein